MYSKCRKRAASGLKRPQKPLSFCILPASPLQNFRKGALTAGVTAHHLCPGSFRAVHCCPYHFMGHCIRKQHQQIRTAYLFSEISTHLGKYLCPALKTSADLFILADHSVMPAYDHNAHKYPLSSFFYTSASCLPSSFKASSASESGAPQQMASSAPRTTAPACFIRSAQSLIHCPSPQP